MKLTDHPVQFAQPPAKRIACLEAARGVASIIVVVHHFSRGFMPSLKASFPAGPSGTPFYWLVSGEAAVIFFFVLSGFVLVLKFYEKPSIIGVVIAALKRLPRLFGPAAITVFLGWVIIRHGLHWNERAAAITGSDWLRSFADGLPQERKALGLREAFSQSIELFIFGHPYYFNSNLWTMSYELYGSIMAFLLLMLTMLGYPKYLKCLVIAAVMVESYRFGLMYLAFTAGVAVSFAVSHFEIPQIKYNSISAILLFGALWLISLQSVELQILGSALLVLTLVRSPAIGEMMSGAVGVFLGKLSFPLYLIHMLVLMSATSFAFIEAEEIWTGSDLPYALAAAVTLVVSVLVAIPLMKFDEWWVGLINSAARHAKQALSKRVYIIKKGRWFSGESAN